MLPPAFGLRTENIQIASLKNIFPGIPNGAIPEQILTNLTLNYTLTGGTFSASFLTGTFPIPSENTVLTFPNGRVGVVKQIGKSMSGAGLVDTISGPLIPLAATQVSFFGLAALQSRALSQIAGFFGASAWSAGDFFIKAFVYRGVALSGIQQLAGAVLGDVLIRNTGIQVVDPGQLTGDAKVFSVPKSDIISVSQVMDYSLDIAAVLNPALLAANLDDPGNFIYDTDHAIKQGKTIVQCGSQQGTGGNPFIPIPDGWMVDGNYDEWTPTSTDLTNPNPSSAVGNGSQYWKVFPSPTTPGVMRGIKNWTRLVKDMKLPGNISTFVGSPITAALGAGPNTLNLQAKNTESGITGFTADETVVPDAVTGDIIQVKNAIQLLPPGGVSGDPTNFFSVQLELWTFPRILPTVFPVGNPTNPFGLPPNVVVVNPNSNILNGAFGYWNYYLGNYHRINSPRRKTNVSVVFRNLFPQVGDHLLVEGLQDAGRIQSVSLAFGRNGMIVTVSAEFYQAAPGLWGGSAGAVFGGGTNRLGPV